MIHIKEVESIPAGSNPFHHDQFNMGTKLAKNVIVMHPSFPDQQTDYIIVVNVETGERIRVAFSPSGTGLSLHEQVMNQAPT